MIAKKSFWPEPGRETALVQLYEAMGRGAENGPFPDSELRSISVGGTIREAIVGKTKSLPKGERGRIRQQDFELWIEGDDKQTIYIIEKEEKPEKQTQPHHLLAGIIRIIRNV